jgi:XTP/dITP diphosphohydrolase
VDALDGAPGVHSKRWSHRADLSGVALDAANNAHLQDMLARAAARGRVSRHARYVCAAACVWPGGEVVVRGTTEGVITEAARGANGFGYDPYFLSDDLRMTFGEATRDAKAQVSHRGRAFAALSVRLSACAWWPALASASSSNS